MRVEGFVVDHHAHHGDHRQADEVEGDDGTGRGQRQGGGQAEMRQKPAETRSAQARAGWRRWAGGSHRPNLP